MTKSPDLLTTAQVANLLGKSVRTVNRMAEAGNLPPAIKVPGKTGAYLFHRADAERLRT